MGSPRKVDPSLTGEGINTHMAGLQLVDMLYTALEIVHCNSPVSGAFNYL